MDQISVSHITYTDSRYAQVWELREQILRIPLGRSLKDDDLSRDYVDTIFIAEHQNKIVGCVMLHKLSDEIVQLRAMAVYSDWQGKGIGRLLVQAAEQFCRLGGYHKIVLHARKVVLGFYISMGYTSIGDEFIEVGIPHLKMEKQLI